MAVFKLTIEYDGGPFVGWQKQRDEVSVQGTLEDAVYAFSGERARVKGAGRTDAGVHAFGQVADVTFESDRWTGEKVRDALNAFLKTGPITVLSAEPAPDDFSARFSAKQRHYLYRLADHRPPLALDRGRAWWWPVALDVDAMADAAQVLVGLHDFTTFRSVHCQAKSPKRRVDSVDVVRVGREIHIEVSAKSFLHNQVRSFVGSLKYVGEGKWSKQDLVDALEARDRTACGPLAPAEGLYLARVDY